MRAYTTEFLDTLNLYESYYYFEATHTHTPMILPQSRCTIEFLDNNHISEPSLELHSRATPSVGGITAQSFQPQGEIPEKGRTEKNTSYVGFPVWAKQLIDEG